MYRVGILLILLFCLVTPWCSGFFTTSPVLHPVYSISKRMCLEILILFSFCDTCAFLPVTHSTTVPFLNMPF